MLLSTQLKFLKGVGEKRAEQFAMLGVDSIDALFHFYPRAYEDWSNPVPIFGAEAYEKCCISATVSAPVTRRRAKSGITVFETSAFDDTGLIRIIIFNNKYAAAKLSAGSTYLFFGNVNVNNGVRQMLSPSIENLGSKARIRPIYRTTKNMSSKYIEGCVERAFQTYGASIEDPLPIYIREKYGLMSAKEAVAEIHFPTSMERMRDARIRFIFEELFELQLGIRLMRGGDRTVTSAVLHHDYSEEFYDLLPFEPTGAQKRAVSAATDDLKSGYLMNRLLQGDVGSGKTMVAAALAYNMARNGYQSAIMAPTEILAAQHFTTMQSFFENTGINVVLLTGNMTALKRREVLEDLKNGKADLAVGTHALISDNVEFKKLGLVMTDEQHRFGVRQRGKLADKGTGVHVLVMSATPIPRTLALAIYGDLDVTVIDELPKGRIPIETYRIDGSIRERAYNYIKKHIDEGRQGYIVCPLVEKGETEGLVSATEYYEQIRNGSFKDYKVGLLHGQMKASEKNDVMERFVSGEIQLLVSTVVIEVGVDVPNAVIMLIENAERFGLSQLHQLRGRVGRGAYRSTCILLSDNKSENTTERLKVMCSTSDGFEIANKDLLLRGPGDFFGSRQHGLPDLRIADMTDMATLDTASEAVSEVLSRDPELALSENNFLREVVTEMFSGIVS